MINHTSQTQLTLHLRIIHNQMWLKRNDYRNSKSRWRN
jgi:hypothetical protein